MTQGFYTIPEEWFINQIIRKYQAYAIVDIENKINRLLLTDTRDEFFDERVSKLMDERTYYERASKAQLLDGLITSARERNIEEEFSDAKTIFDLVLSKRQFSSFH
ncbi:hypothetical protein NXZ75_01055 [Lysinibacillus sphaericus]|uniref:hypothetical protein n=1 Tax=Lysinibacillus sphaericus TaxID=1421 RepID=UPI0021629DDA|nr:hypothetical protein [Lysinibacillus sphaericus]MCS1380765.1 hypothetical protein [Lysinibacillus sphaericus]